MSPSVSMRSKCIIIVSICHHVRQHEVFSLAIHYREPFIERLSFHLPSEHFVVFDEEVPIEKILHKPKTKNQHFYVFSMDGCK